MRSFGSLWMALLALSLSGCADSERSPFSATVDGTMTGLSGTVELVLNGRESQQISENGGFGFRTRLSPEEAYLVTVRKQPATQTCTVANGSGTVQTRSISNIAVTCVTNTTNPNPTNTYAIGGTVSGLAGTAELFNGTEAITLAANGNFTFPTRIATGGAYAVTVRTQPAGVTCTVARGTGVVDSNHVTDITVICQAITHALGGNVAGLIGTLTLSQGGETYVIGSNGLFVLPTRVDEGAMYAVSIESQPATQTCSVSNGSGTMGSGDVSNVAVSCVTNFYSIGGSVSGLVGGYVGDAVLQLNGGETVAVSGDGTFTFPTQLLAGSNYAVTVASQPSVPVQTCTVGNASGTVGAGNVSVTVTCARPTPRFAYAIEGNPLGLGIYSIDASTGALSLNGNVSTQGVPDHLALAPNGRFLYVSSTANGISAYAADAASGVLTEISGSPFSVGAWPRGFSLTPDGRFMHVVQQLADSIVTFAVDPATGALTLVGSPLATGSQPFSIATAPNGKFAYVSNYSPYEVRAYAIEAATGSLTLVGSYPTPDFVIPVMVEPRGRFVYAPGSGSNRVYAFRIDELTGALAAAPGSPFVTGNVPVVVAVDPGSKFAYVAHQNSDNVVALTIDPNSGALTSIAGSPYPAGWVPQGGAVDPSGRFVYVTNSVSLNISAYSVNPTTGALTSVPGSPFPAPGGPHSIVILGQ